MEEININSQIDNLMESINSVQNIFVLLTENANRENILSGLALQQALERNNKNVALYCASEEIKELAFIDQTSRIKGKIDAQSLIISLGYDKEQIEKVGYDSQDGRFNLIVTPKKGKIDPANIAFIPEGLAVDLMITLGGTDFNSLGSSYLDNIEELSGKDFINIDNHEGNTLFGKINIVDPNKATIAELLLPIIGKMGVDWDQIADYLLMAIYSGTNSFQAKNVRAETFIAVSQLLSHGANLDKVISQLYNGGKRENSSFPKSSTEILDGPTPFLKGQEEDISVEEPSVFSNKGSF